MRNKKNLPKLKTTENRKLEKKKNLEVPMYDFYVFTFYNRLWIHL